jgi:hypothetical protein
MFESIVAYLLKARTVEPGKQPLIGNGCVTRRSGVTVGSGVFVRSVPIRYNEDHLSLRKRPETAVRRVGVWCEVAASPGAEERPLLQDVTQQRSEDRDWFAESSHEQEIPLQIQPPYLITITWRYKDHPYKALLDEQQNVHQLCAWFGDFVSVYCQQCLRKFNTMAIRDKTLSPLASVWRS